MRESIQRMSIHPVKRKATLSKTVQVFHPTINTDLTASVQQQCKSTADSKATINHSQSTDSIMTTLYRFTMTQFIYRIMMRLSTIFQFKQKSSSTTTYNSFHHAMISVVVLGFLFGSSTSTNAQITNLKLSTDPITYTEISGGTNLVAGGSAIGAASSVTPIGFDFVFQGNTYSNFSVNAAGLLKLGTVAVTTESANNASSTTNTPKLYAWWDATATVAAANGGGVTFALSGSAPNRVLTVQWRVAYTTNASAGFSYQVKLYETTNVIEYLYGAIPPSGTLDRKSVV